MRPIHIAQASQTFLRTSQLFVDEPRHEPLISKLSCPCQFDHRLYRCRRAVSLGVAIRKQQATDTLWIASNVQLRNCAAAVVAIRSTATIESLPRSSASISTCTAGVTLCPLATSV